jgi:Fic family protein
MFNENSIAQDNMKECWRIITKLCCENKSAGCNDYRDKMVYIGNTYRVTHVPAKPEQIETMMNSLISYSSADSILDAIIYHYYIAYVHPFCDGNGRLVRTICSYILGVKGLPLSKAILIDRSKYYKSFIESEEFEYDKLDITPFVDNMFTMIANACSMYMLYGESLTNDESCLLEKIDKEHKGTVSVMKAAKILDMSETYAIKILTSLTDKGYLMYNSDCEYSLFWRCNKQDDVLKNAIQSMGIK